MPKCDFSKVACNFIEITLPRGRSSVNLWNIFRTPVSKNTSGGLLLAACGLFKERRARKTRNSQFFFSKCSK